MLDRRNDGKLEEAYFNYVFQPMRNAQGKVDGILAHGVEVTEQVHARQVAQESERRRELAQQAGQIGTFEWDLSESRLLWTEEMEALYGLPPGGFEGTYQAWIRRIFPLDLPRFKARLQAALAGGEPWHDEFRAVWPDESVHWLLGKAVI